MGVKFTCDLSVNVAVPLAEPSNLPSTVKRRGGTLDAPSPPQAPLPTHDSLSPSVPVQLIYSQVDLAKLT